MSMNATFVQIDETELARLKKDPAWAETLFAAGPAVLPPSLAALSNVVQDRLRASGPRLMADVLKQMDPRIREQLEARLGMTTSALTSGEGGELLLKAIQERQQRLTQMMPGAFQAAPARSEAPSISAPARELLELDKAWHGVHYVMCGRPEPDQTLLSQAILGGTDIGDDEEGFSGYGPARYFTAAEVAELARTLSRPELETDAAARFDPARMAELDIYPGWDASQSRSDHEWIMDSFRRLRDFYQDAAGKGHAIVTCLV
jgi:hypothetical protein